MTLNDLLASRIQAFTDSGRPQEIIDAGVEKLFKEIVEEAFRSYGDFGKAIKDAFKAALPANISDQIQLAKYNTLVADALRTAWLGSGVEGDMLKKAQAAFEEVMATAAIPSTVSLREILEAFAEENKEKATENHWEHPEIRFEEEYSGAYLHIYFDPEPGRARSNHQLEHALHMHLTGQTGKVYSAKIDELPIGKNLQLYSRWERLVAAIYYGQATVQIDCDAGDISYGIYD